MSANLAWSLSTRRYLEPELAKAQSPAGWFENVLDTDEIHLATPAA